MRESEIILLCVRWYLRSSLSYRDLEEMMRERGLQVDHATIYRWVQHYAPELDKRSRPHLKACNDSWRVDETYIKVKKVWMYLYRAVDSEGNTLEFFLSPTRDAEAAKRFLVKALRSRPNTYLDATRGKIVIYSWRMAARREKSGKRRISPTERKGNSSCSTPL